MQKDLIFRIASSCVLLSADLIKCDIKYPLYMLRKGEQQNFHILGLQTLRNKAAVKGCEREYPVSVETEISKKFYSHSQGLHAFSIGTRFQHFPWIRCRHCVLYMDAPHTPPQLLTAADLVWKTISAPQLHLLLVTAQKHHNIHFSKTWCLFTYSKQYKRALIHKTRKSCSFWCTQFQNKPVQPKLQPVSLWAGYRPTQFLHNY